MLLGVYGYSWQGQVCGREDYPLEIDSKFIKGMLIYQAVVSTLIIFIPFTITCFIVMGICFIDWIGLGGH